MYTNHLPGFIKFLLQPHVYDHPVSEIELVETHISFVILTDNFAYKWKKKADLGFLDFTSLQKRKFYCNEELRLNRRLCPQIYRRLVWISNDSGFAFNGSGVPVEYGIEMIRMPEDRMMGNLIRQNKVSSKHIDDILAVLIPFYKSADSNQEIKENSSRSAVAKVINDNFVETRQFVGSQGLPEYLYNQIRDYSMKFLERKELFEKRIKEDLIRDCHGDLHSGNICLTEQPLIFDCIEFNKNLRYTDIAADLAFLAMDLDYNGLDGLSRYLIDGYVEIGGDTSIHKILNFYKCYRAYVRGKILLLTTLNQTLEQDERDDLYLKSRDYFTLAADYTLKSSGN